MPEKNTHAAIQISIDQTGQIESPHLMGLAENVIHRSWGGFIFRKGKGVKTASLLPRDKTEQWINVSGVVRGSYLVFGASIKQPDNSWEKSHSYYRVEQRCEHWISLLPLTESEVPSIYDIAPAASPRLYALEAHLSMLEQQLENLRQQVDLMRTSTD
ncbi:hypothetical protein [Pseudomonas sp. TNT3]|uniref:hypothetical protein n=1 Tax=Pseudomonas sp. TNT3 TaxID=2654097 RepID=UPI00139092A3|nr:hypothetical protein [Pseudomonas sp. TNT3]KAI2693090.1 hypothetical protein GBC55_007715 [Pseudomonas sp. TNT3]